MRASRTTDCRTANSAKIRAAGRAGISMIRRLGALFALLLCVGAAHAAVSRDDFGKLLAAHKFAEARALAESDDTLLLDLVAEAPRSSLGDDVDRWFERYREAARARRRAREGARAARRARRRRDVAAQGHSGRGRAGARRGRAAARRRRRARRV